MDAAIDYMSKNCQLPPEPDVALHGVLARLMGGSQALRAAPAPTPAWWPACARPGGLPTVFDDPRFGADVAAADQTASDGD